MNIQYEKFVLIDIPMYNLLTKYSTHVSTQICSTQVKCHTLRLPNVS
jgi:hypothetical protein